MQRSTSQPLVSVIIPTFDRAPWLGEAIASVLAQTYLHLELIVVDDGSHDATPEVVQALGQALTYIRQAHAGVSAARNRGVAASCGAFIAFLDSDDLWLPRKIAAQVALLQQQPQAQACYTDEIWIRHGVRVNPRQIHQKHSGWLFEPSLPRCIISPSSIMLRRTLWDQVGGFDESLPACEDYDLWLRLTLCTPVLLLPERLIVKRGGHADQLSRCVPVLDQYRITALEKILTAPLSLSQRQAVLTHLVQKCRIVALGAQKRQHETRWALYHAKEQHYQQQLADVRQVACCNSVSERMAPVFRHVLLTEIALDDHTFIVTYRPEMQALRRSVAHAGVLTPLHLRQLSDQAPLQVVCGSKRLLACQQTGHTSVPALVYNAAELSEQQAFLLALHDNLGCRALNAVEKGRILLRLQQYFGYQSDALLQEFCALLDLPPRAETLQAYGRLATLEDALQAAVVEGSLPLETALWIGAYAAEDRQALLDLFTGLKVGTNRAREFVTYIDEICQRDACPPADLLQALDVPTLLAAAQLSSPQKLESVRRVLRQARYPQLSTYEQRFQEAARRLRLPPQISLRPPPYFEGQQYQVTLSFSQRQELQQYAQCLLDAAQHEALDTLLELL